MKIIPPCTKPAGREASRMVGVKNLTFECPGSPWRCCEAPPWYHIRPFFVVWERQKRRKVSEVRQQVSASLSQPEPYCKTSSVLVPSPFIMAGWPWEEGAWQISILLGEGRLAGETPEPGGKGGTLPLRKFLYAYRILSGEPCNPSAKDSSIKHIQNLKRSVTPCPYRPTPAAVAAPRHTCSCYCSQPDGGVLPLPRHTPVMKRPLGVCKMKDVRQTRRELGKNDFCLLRPFLIGLCSSGQRSFFQMMFV